MDAVVQNYDLTGFHRIVDAGGGHGAAQILRNCAQVALPGATLLIVEPVRSDNPAPSSEPILDLIMLTLLNGRSRTVEQYRELLHSAGWRLDAVREFTAPPEQAPRSLLAQTPFTLLEAHHQA